jgi:putative NIF3 family GTP cyclohydrolase 1 type 2
VTKIGAAVDAGVVPFQKAVAAGVDFLVVHHGMYWDMPRPLTGAAYERVATLVRGDCALYSSHLPLDGDPGDRQQRPALPPAGPQALPALSSFARVKPSAASRSRG